MDKIRFNRVSTTICEDQPKDANYLILHMNFEGSVTHEQKVALFLAESGIMDDHPQYEVMAVLAAKFNVPYYEGTRGFGAMLTSVLGLS